MPIRHGGSFSKNGKTRDRRSWRRITTVPSSSTPWTWKTFFARSRPIVVTSILGGSPIGGYQTTSMAHCDAGGGAVHSITRRPQAFSSPTSGSERRADIKRRSSEIRVSSSGLRPKADLGSYTQKNLQIRRIQKPAIALVYAARRGGLPAPEPGRRLNLAPECPVATPWRPLAHGTTLPDLPLSPARNAACRYLFATWHVFKFCRRASLSEIFQLTL